MFQLDIFLRLSAALLALLMVILSMQAFAVKSIATLTIFSLAVFLALLIVSILLLWRRDFEFFAVVGALFSSLVVGRLFSTMRFDDPNDEVLSSLDPLLVAETGPGIDSIKYTTVALLITLGFLIFRFAWRQSHGRQSEGCMDHPSVNDWGLTFIRLYVGLMFIAHFSGHLFAGPVPFAVFTEYFSSIGLPYPATFVVLAGVIELAVAIGLAFGLMTRIAAIGAAVYLFVSVLLGGHFAVGYIWVLPTGGWEFPALWIFTIVIFALTGGGAVSLDRVLITRFTTLPWAVRYVLT